MSSMSSEIILDEIIEQCHIVLVQDVIYNALREYAENQKGTNYGAVAYCIYSRIDDAENGLCTTIMNPELIESLNL